MFVMCPLIQNYSVITLDYWHLVTVIKFGRDQVHKYSAW